MVAAKVGLGGDRRPCRAAYIFAMRSIPAGFPDWRKVRLVRLCIAECDPRRCNRCRDDCIYVADSPRTATSPIQGAREIRADYRRRGVLFTRPDHHPV